MRSVGFDQAMARSLMALARPHCGKFWTWPGHGTGTFGFSRAVMWEALGLARPWHAKLWV